MGVGGSGTTADDGHGSRRRYVSHRRPSKKNADGAGCSAPFNGLAARVPDQAGSVPMLYVVSKVLQVVFDPGNLLLILLAIGVWRLSASWGRKGVALIVLVLVAGAVAAIEPLAALPLVPLEDRFPVLHTLPDKVDGIILLGGAVDPERTAEYGQVALNPSAARVTETLRLAQHYSAARIVLSGGLGGLLN